MRAFFITSDISIFSDWCLCRVWPSQEPQSHFFTNDNHKDCHTQLLPALQRSTSVLFLRIVWCVLLRYLRAMLAVHALSSTNSFRHKKMVGKITHQVQHGENNEIVSLIETTRSANCSAFFILHYCRTACLVAPNAIASGRCRPISHHLFLIRSQRENSWLILGATDRYAQPVPAGLS